LRVIVEKSGRREEVGVGSRRQEVVVGRSSSEAKTGDAALQHKAQDNKKPRQYRGFDKIRASRFQAPWTLFGVSKATAVPAARRNLGNPAEAG
jgi:hypothetical protein